MRLSVIFDSFKQIVKLLNALLPQEVMKRSEVFRSALETTEEFQ